VEAAGEPAAALAIPQAGAPLGPCDLGLTFFPSNGENKPEAWTAISQQSAGNTRQDQLLKVALGGYPIPSLNVAPVSVFTQVGGPVPVSCVIGETAAGEGVLIKPATYTVSYKMAGNGTKVGPFVKGSKQDPPANVSLSAVAQLPDGDYCAEITLDLEAGSGLVAVGATQYKVPAKAQTLKRQVCFLKISVRPSASITFHTCNTSFAVDLTGITPKPQMAAPGVPLTNTVFHVWGKLNRTFDRRPQAEGLLDYFDSYVKWADPSMPNVAQVLLDSPNLVNGYYNVWIEGSLGTTTPGLVSLFGADQYDDGGAKFMGVAMRNSSNRPVPIQTVASKIENLGGPDTLPPAGTPFTFSWDTQGYGEQFCFVDGKKIANAPDKVHCEAPLSLRVSDRLNHTLSVVLLDVCGQTTTNGVIFGGWGWNPDPKFAPPIPLQVIPDVPIAAGGPMMPPPLMATVRRNRTALTSSAAGLGGFRGVAASVMAAAGLLLMP